LQHSYISLFFSWKKFGRAQDFTSRLEKSLQELQFFGNRGVSKTRQDFPARFRFPPPALREKSRSMPGARVVEHVVALRAAASPDPCNS
jgi:hypothetical protein